jgi:hypothetical protein
MMRVSVTLTGEERRLTSPSAPDAVRRRRRRWFSRARSSPHVWVPCVLLIVCAAPCIPYLLPSTTDALTDSPEPVKTLKFFYTRGQDVHKWGPMTNFVYGPAYAPLLLYWRLADGLAHPTRHYPYGLTRPHQQMGSMILAARAVTLAAVALAVAGLAYALRRVGNPRALIMVVLVVCLVTPEMVTAGTGTKPDGLMLALAMGAMAVYVLIVYEGFSLRRSILLSVLATCSISCKELTAPLFVLPYLGLLARGAFQSRHDPASLRRFLRDYAICVMTGVLAYLLLNVAYAPGSWVQRMHFVLGPLKDPAVWAPPTQTTHAYLMASWAAILRALGYSGTALLAAAALCTVVLRPRHALLLWLPLISHVVIVILTAGYMPDYFMIPLGPLAVLPLVCCGTDAFNRLAASRLRVPCGVAAGSLALLLCAVSLCGCVASIRTRLAANYDEMIEDYLATHAPPDGSVYPFTLYRRNSGSSRLSYLGYHVDDRPLYEIMESGNPSPDVIFVPLETVLWMGQFEERPARALMYLDETGFDYRQFHGFESLGYELADEICPTMPCDWMTACAPECGELLDRRLCVYRKPPHAVTRTAAPVRPRS